MSAAQAGNGTQGGRTTEHTRLQSLLSRHERPRPSDLQKSIEDDERVPLRAPKVQRQGSAMALRNMFSRNRTEKVSQPSKLSVTHTPPVTAPAPPSKPAPAAPASAPKSTTRSLPQPSTTAKTRLPRTTKAEPVPPPAPVPAPPRTLPPPVQPAAKPSRLNLRVKSTRQSAAPVTKPNPTPAPRAPQGPPSRLSAAWDPPPLFQAFPQAVKYAELTASTLSADSILRMSNHKRHNSIREEIAQTPMSPDGTSMADDRPKTPKPRRTRRRISVSVPKPDWTKKIYVLVTSGYLLQYAGSGSFDRLPEKMMQLGKDSVAFASDAIPGKHWVLQISQAINADGAPAADSRSLLSRLNFRGADYRRSATSFLLILNSAEEMDSWIAAVRKEIEGLGGKKHLSETGKPKPDEKPAQLKEQPSHRYLVKRDSALISSPASPQRFSFDTKDRANGVTPDTEDPQVTPRPSASFKPVSNGLHPREPDQAERITRDSSNRFSYTSSGQPTVLNSRPASIASSPTRTSFSATEDGRTKISMDDIASRPNTASVNTRRKSIQALNDPVLISSPVRRGRPYSTYSAPMKLSRTQSPSTPNFSVPISSSRRYSAAVPPAMDVSPAQTEVHAVSTMDSTKPLPAEPEQISVTPALASSVIARDKISQSPVLESGPTVVTPTVSSFQVVPQARPTVVNIPARSLSLKVAPTASKITPPPRRSSVFATTTPLIDMVQHPPGSPPQQIASMQILRNPEPNIRDNPITPSKQAYTVPPDAITTPLPASPNVAESTSKLPRPLSMAEREKLLGPELPTVKNSRPRLARLILVPDKQFSSSLSAPAFVRRTPSRESITPGASSSTATTPARSFTRPSPQSYILRPKTSIGAISPATAPLQTPAKPLSRTLPPRRQISPSLQRLRAEANARAVGTKKSLPVLVTGPPPAPPPDYALPPLPSPASGSKSPLGAGSKGGIRT